MKKLLLIASMIILGANVSAQEKSAGFKGKWFVMGQAGYNSSDNNTVSNYSVLPAVGTFIAPTTAVGAAFGYVGSSVKDSDEATGAFVVQPLVRKYWGVSDKLFIFGQASVPLTFGKNTSASNYETKYTSYGIQLAPGLDYFLSPHWTIETQFGLLGWSGTSYKDGEDYNDFEIGLNSGLLSGVKFGVKYVF